MASRIFGGLYRHYVLVLLTLIYAASFIDRYVLALLLGPIRSEFGVSDTLLGLLAGPAFAIFYAVLGLPVAALADRLSRKWIIAGSLAIFTLATLASGLAAKFWQLAIARIVVGVGEGGAAPASHSMISELYPPKQRAVAMGVFGLGVNLGVVAAYFGGGVLVEVGGWRLAFLAAGAPGLVLLALFVLTVREPLRPSQPRTAQGAALAGFRTLWGKRSYRHIVIGGALSGFAGFSGSQWNAEFLHRAHGLGLAQIGLIMGLMAGVLGGVGTFLGGAISQRVARHDARWFVRLPAITTLASVPFVLAFYLVEDTALAVAAWTIPAVCGAIYLAPAFSVIQSLSEPRLRATAAAIFLLATNVIGLGLGPLAGGLLSDMFGVWLGSHVEGLRWAMVGTHLVAVWAALHIWRAARTLRTDLNAVAPAPCSKPSRLQNQSGDEDAKAF